MQLEEFSKILQKPQEVNSTHIKEISEILKKYPFFQSARAIYLKGLKNIESKTYNHQLKTTAAYTTDRSILFDFIVSEEFKQNEISQSIRNNSINLKDIEIGDVEDISINKKISIDNELQQTILATEGVLDPKLFEEKISEAQVSKILIQNKTKSENPIKQFSSVNDMSAEDKLDLGKPLEFSKDETHSFSEWLQLASIKPIQRSGESTNNLESPTTKVSDQDQVKIKKIELIDKFLTKNPKIIPSKEYTPKPLLYKEEISNEGLMTETLARIYLEQKNYEKAIQSYKILSLKYPEKSSFFADQINSVKELQEKNNTL